MAPAEPAARAASLLPAPHGTSSHPYGGPKNKAAPLAGAPPQTHVMPGYQACTFSVIQVWSLPA